MNLNAVHIDGVLVERTATYVVLTTQFVGLAHTGKGNQQTFDTSARRVRHDARRAGIDIIHRTLRPLNTAHLNLRQYLFVRQ